MPAPRFECEACNHLNAVPAELCAAGCMAVGEVLICADCGSINLDPESNELAEIVRLTDDAYDRE